MARLSSPIDDDSGSPLSSMDSTDNEFPDRDAPEDIMEDAPPTKRLKTATGSVASPAFHKEASVDPDIDTVSQVSSDTDGDVPNSPINARQEEEEYAEQVTICHWEGCRAGDQGNMDNLVEHIHSDHIETRAKKYTCEWIGCTRKGMAHASGYALKAHMRSHTREKPFYCYLPECDRAFTRSDALAKHMRTVHQTEDLRPSDPVSKAHQTTGKSSKNLRIILKTPQSHAAGQDDAVDDSDVPYEDSEDMLTPLDEELFSPEEIAMPREKLFQLTKLQLKWAEEEGKRLEAELKEVGELYKQEWLEKEVLLEQVIRSEKDWFARKQAVLSGEADVVLTAPEAAANSVEDAQN
ncbi:hypothetical protein QC762_109030 [Podospora pseudocomata]|uniref:C2H2-type domain-containing protein n=1 Tax=Podospora pseudocomata TaxID=2093779 RepID=A0ABR0GUE9_9PEZI|nr:hypothetical protein QC762_109030 [Podospora pseudocomata]